MTSSWSSASPNHELERQARYSPKQAPPQEPLSTPQGSGAHPLISAVLNWKVVPESPLPFDCYPWSSVPRGHGSQRLLVGTAVFRAERARKADFSSPSHAAGSAAASHQGKRRQQSGRQMAVVHTAVFTGILLPFNVSGWRAGVGRWYYLLNTTHQAPTTGFCFHWARPKLPSGDSLLSHSLPPSWVRGPWGLDPDTQQRVGGGCDGKVTSMVLERGQYSAPLAPSIQYTAFEIGFWGQERKALISLWGHHKRKWLAMRTMTGDLLSTVAVDI